MIDWFVRHLRGVDFGDRRAGMSEVRTIAKYATMQPKNG